MHSLLRLPHVLYAKVKRLSIDQKLALVAVAFIILLSFLLYWLAGNQTINRTRSQNAALPLQLKADISQLPSLGSIQPGRPSGNLEYVAYTRNSLAKAIEHGRYDTLATSKGYVLLPSYPRHDSTAGEYQAQESKFVVQLHQEANLLLNLKKLCEYKPTSDLAMDLSNDPSTSERLARTQQGLQTAYDTMADSALPTNNPDLLTQLQKLINTAPSVSNSSKAAWAAQVASYQKLLLSSLLRNDIQQSDYAKSLDSIASYYQ